MLVLFNLSLMFLFFISDKKAHKVFYYRKNYKAYLHSKDWKKKRAKVLYRDGNKCVLCKTENRLEVHHITYKNLGDEPLIDLVTLCRSCHQNVHDNNLHKKGRYEDKNLFLYLFEKQLFSLKP